MILRMHFHSSTQVPLHGYLCWSCSNKKLRLADFQETGYLCYEPDNRASMVAPHKYLENNSCFVKWVKLLNLSEPQSTYI